MKNFFLILINCLFIIQVANSQVTEEIVPKKIYTTKIISNAPEIDGVMDDESWNNVEWASDFTQKQPEEGVAPTYQTKFKIVYDDKFLYVGIRALDDEPEKIQKRLTRRDGFAGDRVNVIIDSYHDKRTAFVFTTTAAGVKGEEIATQNGNNWDDSWNPIWYTKVSHDDKGWTTEMKIPFSQLRFGKAKEQIWGLNIVRNLFRKNERSLWQRIPNSAAGFISEAGELQGLINLKPQKQLEIQPFTVIKYDTYQKETGNPYRTGSDFSINGGLDAKIGITNDLTLDVTINPDFGQVEADPGAIALDGFQVFFREQRPFFVENKNIFDFKIGRQDNIFYSRRIGRSPQGNVSLEANEFADVPTNTAILGAAKFSGKTRSGWSIGILESITANEYAKVYNNGTEREEIVEPLTNYVVVRAQKDFNERNSFIGGIFTATNRNLDGNFNNLHKAAYTGGIDFRHDWNDRNYSLSGNFSVSHVIGSKEAITETQQTLTHMFHRVDATHVSVDQNRTSLTGTGGRIFVGKRGGGNWRYLIGSTWKSPELELNDIGFLRQTDQIWAFGSVEYLWQKPTDVYRNIASKITLRNTFDFEGNYNRQEFEWKAFVNWANNWGTEVQLVHKPRIILNSFLRGGPRWRYSEENIFTFSVGTDQSKKFNLGVGYANSVAKQDNFKFRRYELNLNYQPFDALSVSLNTAYTENPNKTQYVNQEDFSGTTRYILGEINNQSLSTTLRLNYSINPNLSIQYYGQPFVARGRYKNFNFVNNSLAKDLNERVSWYDTNQILETNNTYFIDENLDGNVDYQFDNPDFSVVQFRSNLVMRWEYIPGSELFFVWSKGTSGEGIISDSLTDTINNQVFGTPTEDTFLIKATYRFVK